MLRSRTLSRAALVLALGLALCAKPAAAQVDGEGFTPGAGCPAGSVTGHANTASWDTFFECNSSDKWQRGPYFFGSTGDTCDSSHAGLTYYNSTTNYLEYCNGSAWTQLEPVQSTPVETAPSGSGYFVLTKGTYNGNLGGLSGANATCLTDLTTNTGWQGYSTANSRGYLVAGNVFAFMCDSVSCNNLLPLTTYYFANAANSSAGGAYFTTDSSGDGPGDSADWAAANYFGNSYFYWTGREASSGSSTEWPISYTSIWDNSCTTWTSASSSVVGFPGQSAYTDYTRWGIGNSLGEYPCNNTYPLICFVNP